MTPRPTKLKLTNLTTNLPTIQAQVDAYNGHVKITVPLLAGDLNSTIGSSDSGKRIINDDNMKFTKKSSNGVSICVHKAQT